MSTLQEAVVEGGQGRRVLSASLIGTTIELFDFYIYGTAAVLVFPALFFPSRDPLVATLESLVTFSVAFLARPIGSIVLGHIGDRVGRKMTLIASLMLMGISTVAIGLLPSYARFGITAPILLTLCRFGQGLGLGGEWGGAVLLAVENAPPGKRAWYGMVPQLGAPLGFFLAGAVYVLLTKMLSPNEFLSFGWRIPFLASATLVWIGLRYRLSLTETPAFLEAVAHKEIATVPAFRLVLSQKLNLLCGTLACVSTFVLFYIVSIFCLKWATMSLGYSRSKFLLIQLAMVPLFAATMPVSAWMAKKSRFQAMLAVTILIGLFGCVFALMFSGGTLSASLMLGLAMCLMGLTYGPLGTLLSELFPTNLRYTGSSLCYSFGAILGASLAPYTALWLAERRGLAYVGYYITLSSLLTMIGLFGIRRRSAWYPSVGTSEVTTSTANQPDLESA
jgi:MFS family permease